jgi:DNA-binding NarL/FixJ family response regulator
MGRPRVLLADDHAAVAAELRGVLGTECEVVATVGDGYALLAVAAALAPDVVVTDVAMPGLDGLAAARALLQRDPAARVVFVTVHTDAALVRQGLEAGALGYVPKLAAGEELLPAVRAALRGERYVSRALGGGGE